MKLEKIQPEKPLQKVHGQPKVPAEKIQAGYRPKYHRDGTITIWNVYRQQWIKNVLPSELADEIWASHHEEDRQKWQEHEAKYAR